LCDITSGNNPDRSFRIACQNNRDDDVDRGENSKYQGGLAAFIDADAADSLLLPAGAERNQARPAAIDDQENQ
jgi:hypothetical protein